MLFFDSPFQKVLHGIKNPLRTFVWMQISMNFTCLTMKFHNCHQATLEARSFFALLYPGVPLSPIENSFSARLFQMIFTNSKVVLIYPLQLIPIVIPTLNWLFSNQGSFQIWKNLTLYRSTAELRLYYDKNVVI